MSKKVEKKKPARTKWGRHYICTYLEPDEIASLEPGEPSSIEIEAENEEEAYNKFMEYANQVTWIGELLYIEEE